MALTKISGEVIQTGSNISLGGVNASGVITATSFVGDGSGITNISGVDPDANINTTGIITAGSFVGDGSQLTGVSGFATALSSDQTSPLSFIFKTPKQLNVGSGVSITVESDTTSGNVAFMRESVISIGGTLHVGSGTTLKTNVLNLF